MKQHALADKMNLLPSTCNLFRLSTGVNWFLMKIPASNRQAKPVWCQQAFRFVTHITFSSATATWQESLDRCRCSSSIFTTSRWHSWSAFNRYVSYRIKREREREREREGEKRKDYTLSEREREREREGGSERERERGREGEKMITPSWSRHHGGGPG